MVTWETVPGETPIDPSGLKKRGSINNHKELAAAEALNISDAFLKYLAAKPSRRSAPFDYDWFLRLHEEMFGDVWVWAGDVRTQDLNLGVPHDQLSALADDLHTWSESGHPLPMQAVWLHHRSVRIHPFENGNGRWARLLSNIWLKLHDEPIVAWPDRVSEASAVRDEYITAINAAGVGDETRLTGLHHRFSEGS